MSDKLIKSIKGINDILPEDVEILQNLEKVIYNIANQYCISEIRLPLLEKTELFKRSIGIGSEIVEKEMIDAFNHYAPSVPMDVEAQIEDHWVKG